MPTLAECIRDVMAESEILKAVAYYTSKATGIRHELTPSPPPRIGTKEIYYRAVCRQLLPSFKPQGTRKRDCAACIKAGAKFEGPA